MPRAHHRIIEPRPTVRCPPLPSPSRVGGSLGSWVRTVSAKERRVRRQRHPDTRSTAHRPVDNGEIALVKPVPQWRWMTFPVFFALSVGLFVGVYAGWLAGFIASDSGNQSLTTIVFIVAALFMGFSLSRVVTRFIVSHNWVKPRVKR